MLYRVIVSFVVIGKILSMIARKTIEKFGIQLCNGTWLVFGRLPKLRAYYYVKQSIMAKDKTQAHIISSSETIRCWHLVLDDELPSLLQCWVDISNSQYPGYTWRHLMDTDLSSHMVLRLTYRFLPHTVKSFHSSFHTNKMVGNHSDEISINESVSIKEELV